MNINPFIVSGKIPAELYCDRNQETANLLKFLQSQENVVLMSQRRMGKTKLVEHCSEANELDKQYILMYADILHTTSLREFIQLLGGVVFDSVARRSAKMMKLFTATVKSLRGSFGYDPILNTPTFDIRLGDITAPEYTLKEIFECIEKADRRCIIVIDEFQQVTKYSEKNVEALLRSHIQNVSNANFVFSGSRRRLMEEMFFSAKRPFYQSAKPLRLEAIDKEVYFDFALSHFQNAEKAISMEAFTYVYETFWGVTLYVQRLMKDAYIETSSGMTCDLDMVKRLIEYYIKENDSHLREQLSFITEAQKELLYAIHAEGHVQSITSSAFNKKHRLRSPSSTQSAALKLLEYDLITRKEKTYSLSDPLLSLWLNRR